MTTTNEPGARRLQPRTRLALQLVILVILVALIVLSFVLQRPYAALIPIFVLGTSLYSLAAERRRAAQTPAKRV